MVDFTDPYYAGGLVVLTKKDGPIKTLKDMDGRKVSVQVGTKSVNYLKEHFPSVQRVEVEKNQEMFSLVQIGRAEAAVTGKPAAVVRAKHAGPDRADRAGHHRGIRHRRAQEQARADPRPERRAGQAQG